MVSGCISALVETSTFVLLLRVVGFGLVISNITSFVIALVTSFMLNKLWAFKSQSHTKTLKTQALIYLLIAGANVFASSCLIVIFVEWLSFSAYLGKILAMMCIAVWNFFLFKTIVFKKAD